MAESKIAQTANNYGNNYCKTPDGMLIQWGLFTISVPANSYKEYTLHLPISYTNVASISVTPIFWGDPRNISVLQRGKFQGEGTFRIGNTSSVAINMEVAWIAVGRWK